MSEKIATKLSPFELSLFLEKRVTNHSKHDQVLLDAARGNPNWTAPIPREAFFLLGQFATMEISAYGLTDSIGTVISELSEQQLATDFEDFLGYRTSEGSKLLTAIWQTDEIYLGMPKVIWLKKILDYIIGDNYPNPVKNLPACAHPIKQYLTRELFSDQKIPFDIFCVEGGTAGICYLFDTLRNNFLLEKGDKIALMLPTFAPYLEIPELEKYQFDVIPIYSEQIQLENEFVYDYSDHELDKLKDPAVKALFVVNPSNPTANSLSAHVLETIGQILEVDNPELMILTDDVYGTFIDGFTSLFTLFPFHTACIYSYSKYFGATGWRIGTIVLAEHTVFDAKLDRLSSTQKNILAKRYETLHADPTQIKFIDRLVADSRDVALNHAAGISAPQQVMMALFSLYALLDTNETYKQEVMSLCRKREDLFTQAMGILPSKQQSSTAYYYEMDLKVWFKERYGNRFSDSITRGFTITDLLVKLAETQNVVLLKTDGFGSNEWSIRISLANLSTTNYTELGKRLVRFGDQLYAEWQNDE